MSSLPHRYDVFVSYAQADREWVEGFLLDALEAAGVRVIAELAFQLGVPRLLEFERAVEQSSYVLLVLSPAYFAEQYAQFVDVLAQSHGLNSNRWRVLPLMLRPVDLPPRLRNLTRLDATQPTQHEGVVAQLCKTLQAPPPAPAPAAAPPCPYPGMLPFSESTSEYFYGREKEIAALLGKLRLHPFVAVIGPSGSGKSSLVQAGLLPALRNSGLFGPGEWLVRSVRPGTHPLAALTHALDVASPEEFHLPTLLSTEPGTTRLLLVVDQLEELFTQSGEEHAAFLDGLNALIELDDCYVVMTVRADFYSDLMTSTLWPQIEHHQMGLTPLDDESLRAAVAKPAERVGVFIEAALVERLVAHAAGEPGVLPFVQEILVRLWERLARRFLPLAAYETLAGGQQNGLRGVMAQIADERLHQLLPPQQILARRILLRLVQFIEGRTYNYTRRQQPVSTLRAVDDDGTLLDQTLHYLADHRLLTLSSGGNGERLVDISHEALLNSWPTLQRWIAERRDAEQTRRRLEGKAQEWVRFGRGEGGLLDATELAEAEAWLGGGEAAELGGAGQDLRAMIEASRVAINPGWHRWGATLLGIATLAIAGAVGLIVLATQEITSSLLRVTVWITFGVLLVSLVFISGLLRRDTRFRGQKLSHSLVRNYILTGAVTFTAVAVIAIWSSWGVVRAEQEAYCTEPARGFEHYIANQDRVAISTDEAGIDPLMLEIISRIFENRTNARAWVVSTDDLAKCERFFEHRITLVKSEVQDEGISYRPNITPPPLNTTEGIVPGAFVQTDDCDGFAEFAYNVAADMGLELLSEVKNDNINETNCAAFIYNEQGSLSLQKFDFETAEEKFREAISAAEGTYPTAHNNLGVTYLRWAEHEMLNADETDYYKKALQQFRTAASIAPASIKYMAAVGVACTVIQDYECAEDHLKKAIELEPNDVRALINYAFLNSSVQQYQQAEQSLESALSHLDSVNATQREQVESEIYMELAILRLHTGELDEAASALLQAARLHSAHHEKILYYQSQLHLETGDTTTACSELKEYIYETPHSYRIGEADRKWDAWRDFSAYSCG